MLVINKKIVVRGDNSGATVVRVHFAPYAESIDKEQKAVARFCDVGGVVESDGEVLAVECIDEGMA